MKTNRWKTDRYYGDERGNRCLFVDTRDPYKLMVEAREARDILSRYYVNGQEFMLPNSAGVAKFYQAMELKEIGVIPGVCAIGAVYYAQGHHAYECNLIQALNRKAKEMFGIKETIDDEPCPCGEPDCDGITYIEFDTIVAVNDGPDGKKRALAVFDAVIADYTQEAMRAEWMAEDYPEPSFGDELHHRLGSVFKYTHSGPPVNYGCGPNGCDTPATVELDQVIEWTQ